MGPESLPYGSTMASTGNLHIAGGPLGQNICMTDKSTIFLG